MTITSTSIGLSWSAPASGAAVTAYSVLYRVNGSGQPFTTLADGITATNYNATGLTSTITYDFAVYARNSAGPGVLSGIVTQATLGAVPGSPGSFTPSAGSPAYSSVNLTWTAPVFDSTHGAAATYTVSISAGNTGTWTVYQSGIISLSQTVNGLTKNTLYGFKVDAINVAGVNSSGATTTLTTGYAAPNATAITSVAPVNDGTTSKLTVTWSASTTDSTHDAATSYNLRYTTHGGSTWTTVTGVTSPYVITSLTAGQSYDIEVQGANASTASPGAWSSITTASTYSRAISYGISGAPQASFTHGSGNINGVSASGMNGVVSGNPSNVYFAATTSNVIVPLAAQGVSVSYVNSTYNYAAYYGVPSTANTYYFWIYTSDGSGAKVSSAITVT